MSLIAKIRVGTLFLIGKMLTVRVPETITGAGSREKIGAWCKAHGYQRALVIMDQVVKDLGIADKLLQSLDREGIEYIVYDGVKPNPTVGMARAAAELGKKKPG